MFKILNIQKIKSQLLFQYFLFIKVSSTEGALKTVSNYVWILYIKLYVGIFKIN